MKNMLRRKPLIAVVGDGDCLPESEAYRKAYELGALLVCEGYRVLTGGRGGVMEAASRGAHESPDCSAGDVIALLPGHDPAGANGWADVVIPTGLSHARNTIVAQSDAIVAVGGGAGTLSEMALAWVHLRLVVALRARGWSEKLADTRLDERIRYPDIPDDRVFGVDDAAGAVAVLRERLSRYGRRLTPT